MRGSNKRITSLSSCLDPTGKVVLGRGACCCVRDTSAKVLQTVHSTAPSHFLRGIPLPPQHAARCTRSGNTRQRCEPPNPPPPLPTGETLGLSARWRGWSLHGGPPVVQRAPEVEEVSDGGPVRPSDTRSSPEGGGLMPQRSGLRPTRRTAGASPLLAASLSCPRAHCVMSTRHLPH